MTDRVSPETRSWNMSCVGSRDTKPERIVRSALWRLGYRFRLHRRDLPGRPDIVLPKYKTAIMVHGCFWHHHSGCKKSEFPRTNAAFWRRKILANAARDRRTIHALRRSGWRVLTVWECETKRASLSQRLRRCLEMAHAR